MLEEAKIVYHRLRRFEIMIAREPQWNTRWCKMALRAFKLPGGGGIFREPLLMPDDYELAKFVSAAIELDIPEINEFAYAAGLI
jgi:hypothetical protein